MSAKVLNLYAGIGGNRKLWKDVEVTAVENNEDVAKIYQDFFPKDKMIIADAHDYLLKHYKEYDFIWSSPPCPTHSDVRRAGTCDNKKNVKVIYPDMSLYQEIILLMHFGKGKWVVENVKPYYEPLIRGQNRGRHYFWSNFIIPEYDMKDDRTHDDIFGSSTVYGVNIAKYLITNKRQILRNMVNPKLGLHVFNAAVRQEQMTLV